MHSVELLPDPATERAVRDAWRRLADAGLPSQAGHRHPTNRPHLTLASADGLPPEVRARLLRLLAEALPVPLRLDGLVRFSGRVHVLAWAVRPDDALLRLHEAVWRALREAPESGRANPLLDPVRWVPHITLGRGREASWDVPGDGEFSPSPGTPADVPAGAWTSARSYDSATRTVERLVP
ncbi:MULTISPECIES: 2'-5' RNA ligase family protein [unclassified Streptomyces]|uniref:2'-5' RNA ligase family protein n=1 Tax=unclassified Streptomyces TaxID=2593676 RepID=UPI0033A0322E